MSTFHQPITTTSLSTFQEHAEDVTAPHMSIKGLMEAVISAENVLLIDCLIRAYLHVNVNMALKATEIPIANAFLDIISPGALLTFLQTKPVLQVIVHFAVTYLFSLIPPDTKLAAQFVPKTRMLTKTELHVVVTKSLLVNQVHITYVRPDTITQQQLVTYISEAVENVPILRIRKTPAKTPRALCAPRISIPLIIEQAAPVI